MVEGIKRNVGTVNIGDISGTVSLPTGASTSVKQLADNHNVTVSNMIPAVETGLATSTNQTDGSQKTQIVGGALVTESFDYIALTYVSVGNGLGEIETATYKTGGAGGSTVAVITLTYNANNEIASVTKV